MARIRSIKPTIWTDERFIGLSRDARLLCIGMISHADDEGRLLATVVRLAGDIFPADDLRPALVLKWRDEIARSRLIRLYRVGGVEYACFPNWKKHQRISKPQPSTLPGPDEVRNRSTTERGTVPHLDPEPFHNQAHPSRAEAPTSRRQETGDRKGEERNGTSVGDESSSVADARAKPDDEESKIEEKIIGVIYEQTGRYVPAGHAAKVRRQLLDDRDVRNPLTYVAAAIRGEPRRYLPTETTATA